MLIPLPFLLAVSLTPRRVHWRIACGSTTIFARDVAAYGPRICPGAPAIFFSDIHHRQLPAFSKERIWSGSQRIEAWTCVTSRIFALPAARSSRNPIRFARPCSKPSRRKPRIQKSRFSRRASRPSLRRAGFSARRHPVAIGVRSGLARLCALRRERQVPRLGSSQGHRDHDSCGRGDQYSHRETDPEDSGARSKAARIHHSISSRHEIWTR